MHKLLFDQNVSYLIINQIEYLFPKSSHVRLLELDRADDLTIWQYAKNNNFHIVTKDIDFNAMNAVYGYPPKVIWIHTGNISSRVIVDLLQKKYQLIEAFLDNENSGIFELS